MNNLESTRPTGKNNKMNIVPEYLNSVSKRSEIPIVPEYLTSISKPSYAGEQSKCP